MTVVPPGRGGRRAVASAPRDAASDCSAPGLRAKRPACSMRPSVIFRRNSMTRAKAGAGFEQILNGACARLARDFVAIALACGLCDAFCFDVRRGLLGKSRQKHWPRQRLKPASELGRHRAAIACAAIREEHMNRLCLLAAAATLFAAPAFAQDDTITIGMTNSLTGPLNVDSLGLQRGEEYWRDEVNAAGGIKAGGKSYKVKFVTYDDQSVGGRVQQLYTRLVNQDHAQFLFSPYSSGLTAAAAVISEQYGKIMIDAGGAEKKPFLLGNKYLFMVITQADDYLAGAIKALAQKNPHARVAMVYSDDPFSKTVLAAAKGQAKDAGLDVVMDESYAPSTTDFGPIVNKIISSNADAFLGGGHYSDGATLARQMYDQRANMKWISILVAPGDDKFAELGGAALGATGPSQGEPQVSLSRTSARPRRSSPRGSRRNSTPRLIITPPPAMPRARSSSMRSSRPNRSSRKKSLPRSTRPTSPPSSAASSSRPIPPRTDCRSRTRWCWRNGRRATTSLCDKSSGRSRLRPLRSSIRSRRASKRPGVGAPGAGSALLNRPNLRPCSASSLL